MKFAEHLGAHITPEWRKQYINYDEMKTMLYSAVEAAPSAENVEQEIVSRHFANFDENFFHYCDQELKKINTFYSEKLAEATRKFANLQSEMKTTYDGVKQRTDGKKAVISNRKVQELKLAFSEFYLSLILLQNYQNLNHTGFRKILKKHDKLLNVSVGAKWRAENVEQSHFYINKDIDRLISDTEASVTSELEGGDRQRAMKRLRVPPLGEQQSPWTTFKVGLFSGSFIVLVISVILSGLFHSSKEEVIIALRLYRGPFLMIAFLFLIGVNVYGWRSSGVNHVLIFELDPRNHLSEQHLMEMAAVFGVVWALSLLSFFYSASLSVPPLVNPLVLTGMMCVFIFNPLRIFKHEARFWFLKIVGRMIAAPFFQVAFADFWMADQLNSLVTALLDFQFLTCFYITNGISWVPGSSVVLETSQCMEKSFIVRPIVNCLPAWFRFAQCVRRYRDTKDAFPHLLNAGKYFSTFVVVVFTTLKNFNDSSYENYYDNPYFYMWLLSQFISSMYAYLWDLKMDWGLFDGNSDNKILREEIVYSSNSYYYFAIIEDAVLRFIWGLSYIVVQNNWLYGEIMVTIQALMEVFRRFIWNFFRLENEHLNNCGQFRAVRDISVAPLDSSDQITIMRMMDEENGVVNRHLKKKTPKKNKDPEKRALIKKDSIHDLHLEMDVSSKKL